MEENKETSQVTNEIIALEKMNELSQIETPAVTVSKIDSPTDRVEEKLSDFLTDVFIATKKDQDFVQALQDELLSRRGEMTVNQLIAATSNANVNLNDKISKTIGPTFSLMTAKQQAEIAERNKENQAAVNVNIGTNGVMKSINEGASQEAIQGLDILYNLVSAINKKD